MSRKHISRASKKENKGMNRREFLTECALPTMTALTLSPLMEGLIRHQTAMAEGSPSSSWVPFAHVHLSGGWGFNGTFVGKTADGNIVSRNTMIQHGIANGFGTPGLVTALGGQMYGTNVSSFTQGLLETLSPAAQAKTRLAIYHTESPDDNTPANASGMSPLLTLAGMNGLLASAAGTRNSPTGNDTMGVASHPASQRLTVTRVNDVLNALAFSKVLTNHGTGMIERLARSIADLSSERLARLGGANGSSFKSTGDAAVADFIAKTSPSQGPESLNPAADEAIRSVYGLTAQTATQIGTSNNAQAIQATLVKATLEGNIGPVAFLMGGYDYHQTALSTTNQRNRDAGIMVGRMLQAAANKGKPIVIWGTTDGGVSAQGGFDPSNQNSIQWAGDRSRYSGAFLLTYFPGSVPAQVLTNVGAVEATGGQIVQTTATATVRMATAHAFYTIAAMSGKVAAGEKALQTAGYSASEVAAIRAMPKLFNV